MVHTALFGNVEDAERAYEAMKQEIQDFLDSYENDDEIERWCSRFTSKY